MNEVIKMVRVDNGSLAYQTAGSGGGSPAVVLLHSGPLNMRMWDPQFAGLAEIGTVVRYDARGYGRSSPPDGDYSNAEDLRALLLHAGLDRVYLVGISLGARTAIDFALTYPTMVRGLVLGSPGMSGAETTDPFVLEKEAALPGVVTAMDAGGILELVLQMRVDGPRRTADEVDPAVRTFCGEMLMENLAKQAAAVGVRHELRATDRLHELTCPMLAIAGQLDSVDIFENARRLGTEPPNSHFAVLDGCGHQLTLEAPERFTELCLSLLAGHPNPTQQRRRSLPG